MTKLNDWASMGEELEEIKATAHHEGYKQALKDAEDRRTNTRSAEEKLQADIDTWNICINKVRLAWSGISGQPERVLPQGAFKYDLMFGNVQTDNYMNMPENTDEFVHALHEIVTKANDFQMLLDAFETNPMVKEQWNKILVMMRLTDCGTN